jgi:hypothetical protein
MTRYLLAILILCGLIWGPAFPAAAQDTQAMEMMDADNRGKSEFPSQPDTLRRVATYGRCVAEFVPGKLLSMLPSSPQDLKLVSGIARFSSCSLGNLQFPRIVLRGMVAEYRFEHDFDAGGVPKAGHTMQKIYESPNAEKLANLTPDIRSSVVMVDVGTCVAKANPAGVASLLSTDAATSEEKAAYAALVPAIGGCLPGGVELRMHRMLMRGYIAEGAYRAAIAANGGAK